MNRLRIRIEDQEQRARGLVAVMRRRQIVCLPDNQFIVQQSALTLLDEIGVQYELIGGQV